MSQAPPGRIAFLGFGLIAGSVARALSASAATRPSLVGWSPSNAGPEAAVRDGVLDVAAGGIAEALDGADLVVIGAPPIETLELLSALGGSLGPSLRADAVVTDVASTKARVVGAADAAGLRFVGGHPMAGRETAGYRHAQPDLFAGRPWVLVAGAHADEAAMARVEWLAVACGARPVVMDAATHDAATSAISHLPLIVAAALVEAVAGVGSPGPRWQAAAPLRSTGWRDMTRLALGDPHLGAGIAATNAVSIAEDLRSLRAVLDRWIVDLGRDGGPRANDLESRLRAVRDRLAHGDPDHP